MGTQKGLLKGHPKGAAKRASKGDTIIARGSELFRSACWAHNRSALLNSETVPRSGTHYTKKHINLLFCKKLYLIAYN